MKKKEMLANSLKVDKLYWLGRIREQWAKSIHKSCHHNKRNYRHCTEEVIIARDRKELTEVVQSTSFLFIGIDVQDETFK